MYSPLSKDLHEIRVLHLLPGSNNETISSYFTIESLSSVPVAQYEAVSYAWGHDSTQRTITISDSVMEIPTAAEEVLQALRYPHKERVVWIDVICINQYDVRERNHQVSMMGVVYSSAVQTIAWLGLPDGLTIRAFASLELVYKQCQQETNGCIELRDTLYGRDTRNQIFQYSKRSLPETTDFTALRALFSRRWFERRWVVQECSLANQGTVLCGSSQIEMIKLFRAAVWIQHKQHQLPFDLDQEGGMLNASYMSAYVDHEQGWFSRVHGQKPFLADLFRYFRTFDVSEHRDRVYAVLGLAQWASRTEQLPKLVEPDYERPVHEIIRDATRAAIIECGDLWVFRYIEHTADSALLALQDDLLPSWVPSLFRLPNVSEDSNPLRSAFRANKNAKKTELVDEVRTSSDLSLLRVDGIVYGTIMEKSSTFDSTAIVEEQIALLLANMLVKHRLSSDHKSWNDTSHIKVESLYDEVALALVGGSPMDLQADTGTYKLFVGSILEATAACPQSDGELHVIVDAIKIIMSREEFRRCVWAIKYACTNRSLFQVASPTSSSIGLGPKGLQHDDAVVVLNDSRLPMIIRPASNDTAQRWTVVGPCFVHAIMQGELVQQAEKGQVQYESFDLY